APGEVERGQLVGRGRALRDDLRLVGGDDTAIAGLDQDAARDGADRPAGDLLVERPGREQPEVLLLAEDLARGIVEGGRDHALEEGLAGPARQLAVDAAVDGDDAAEGRDRVGRARQTVGLGDGGGGRDAARVRVLDDDRGRAGELQGAAERAVEV